MFPSSRGSIRCTNGSQRATRRGALQAGGSSCGNRPRVGQCSPWRRRGTGDSAAHRLRTCDKGDDASASDRERGTDGGYAVRPGSCSGGLSSLAGSSQNPQNRSLPLPLPLYKEFIVRNTSIYGSRGMRDFRSLLHWLARQSPRKFYSAPDEQVSTAVGHLRPRSAQLWPRAQLISGLSS